MQIINSTHDFNREIKFSHEGLSEFVLANNLQLENINAFARKADGHARYLDDVDNLYSFEIQPERFKGTAVYAVFSPAESRVTVHRGNFD